MNIPKFITDIGANKGIINGFLGILVLLFSCCATAKPLYVIGETVFATESNIFTYDAFLDGSIEYVTENIVTARCQGPADLAFTPDGKYMFTVSRGSAWIQVIDTVTMTIVEEEHVSPTLENFSGVAFDPVRNLVYSVDKGQDQLYVYNWDRANVDLMLAENGRITLPNTSACDIALDLTRDLLFVSNGTNQIHVFNAVDWSLNRVITLGHNVERIDIDERNQVLYAGTQISGHPNLIQYDLLSTMVKIRQIGDDAQVMGIVVDDSTSLVYVASLHPHYVVGSNKINVFGAELNALDQVQVDGYLAGLGLPVAGISYSPLTVSKRIASGTELIGGVHYATGGDILTYEICFENRSAGAVGNVEVIDELPGQVAYLGADLFGVDGDMQAFYNPDTHSYEIRMQTLDPNSLRCALITVRLHDDLESGFSVVNKVTADSIQTPQVVGTAECVIRHNALGVSKKVVDDPSHYVINGIHYVDRGSFVTYEFCFTNNNTGPATNVIITDHLPESVIWVSSDLDGGNGFYDPSAHAYTWTYAQLDPNASDCLQITVLIPEDLPPGEQITNRVSIQSHEVAETWASVDVITKFDPLAITKKVFAGAQPNPVNGLPDFVYPGDIITYTVTVTNPSVNPPVHNVAIVDKLPPELEYVSSLDVNDILGVYDPDFHAVTWLYPSLMPTETLTIVLEARVKLNVGPGSITNEAVVLGSEAPPMTTLVDVIVDGSVDPPDDSAQLIVYASAKVGGSFSDELLGVLILPPQVNLSHVDRNVPLVLDPGGTEASFQIVYGSDGKVIIDAYFDKTNLLAILNGLDSGAVRLRVTGRLVNGDQFSGETTIPVTGNLLLQE
jgi:uncharacterized repeat protein (TIGR01451 family)